LAMCGQNTEAAEAEPIVAASPPLINVLRCIRIPLGINDQESLVEKASWSQTAP